MMTKKKKAKRKNDTRQIVKKGTKTKALTKAQATLRGPRQWRQPIMEANVVKHYVVRLSAEERERLESMIHKGKISAGHMRRAQILLKADVSEAGGAWNDSRIAEAFDTNVTTVHRVRKQLVEEGLEAVFTRKKRETPPVEKIFDGAKEAKLIALTCSKPPEGYARWSLRLLEKKVVELHIVDKASDSTIGRVLKKIS